MQGGKGFGAGGEGFWCRGGSSKIQNRLRQEKAPCASKKDSGLSASIFPDEIRMYATDPGLNSEFHSLSTVYSNTVVEDKLKKHEKHRFSDFFQLRAPSAPSW